MTESPTCPECGALWTEAQTCIDYFHTMAAWELDHRLYDVHHLMVLSYHLQHPSLYSPYGLSGAKGMLIEFLEGGITPPTMRKRIGKTVNSETRTQKITGTPDSHGRYDHPIQWTMWAGDVVHAGIDHFYANVQAWGGSVLRSLRESGNL